MCALATVLAEEWNVDDYVTFVCLAKQLKEVFFHVRCDSLDESNFHGNIFWKT